MHDDAVSTIDTLTYAHQDESEPKVFSLTVPEFEAYLATCDEDDFVDDLNHPRSIAIAGLGDWMSSLERKMLKEGSTSDSASRTNSSASGSLLQWEDAKWKDGTWINCDLRQYDLRKLGKFDVVLVDPPWRIRGAQVTSEERNMLGTSKMALEYNTMSSEEIMGLNIGSLSDRGFVFLWTINAQLPTAMECLKQWGYTYVDRITWVKKTARDRVFIGTYNSLIFSHAILKGRIHPFNGFDSFCNGIKRRRMNLI